MDKKVVLGLFLIRFQGSNEDGLEISRGWRSLRRMGMRHVRSNSDELAGDGRETERLSRGRGTSY